MPRPLEIAGYEVLGPLRPGSSVQRAREQRTNRPCALRVLGAPPAGAPGGEGREVELDAERLLQFHHPNVARVYDVGTGEDGAVWVAQELVEGWSIEELLAALGGALPVPAALALVVQVGEALAGLDQAELVHLDVSPATVVVTREGWAKLGDLGAALGPEVADRLTQGDVPLESADYVAPELIEGDLDPTSRADVYSLGATVYRALGGRTPFSGRTLFERIHAILGERPLDLWELDPRLPEAAALLVARLMERDRDDRPLPIDLPRYGNLVADKCGLLAREWEFRALAEAVGRAGRPPTSGVHEPRPPAEPRILVRLRSKDGTFEFPLASGEHFEVGRSSDSALTLPHPWISRRHARIERTDDGVFLHDLGSANGVRVNGEPLEGRTLLEHRDKVHFGKSKFVVASFKSAHEPPPAETRCRLCDARLEEADEGVCARCRKRVEADLASGQRRVQRTLSNLGFTVHETVDTGGLFKRYRVSQDDQRFLASVAELGQRAANAFAGACGGALRLDHDRLLPVRNVLIQGGEFIVLYDDFAGPTLETRVATDGVLAPDPVARLGLALADACAYAFAQGVTCFLVRPELVLLGRDGAPRLLDAGLAPGLVEVQRTRLGLAPVQPTYEAPELQDAREGDESTVVYAVGATLAYALTGRPVAELRGRERFAHPPLTSQEGLPQPIAYLLARATSPDLGERPGTLSALRDALRALVAELEVGDADPHEQTQRFDKER